MIWTGSRSSLPGLLVRPFFCRSGENSFWASKWVKWSRQAGLQCTFRRPLNCPDNGVHVTVFSAQWLFGVSGGLYFTERSTFNELGGFNEELYCAEDSAFLLALRRHGRRIGKGFRILKNEVTTTSSRSFDRFGDWFYVINLPRILLHGGIRAFRSPGFCSRYLQPGQVRMGSATGGVDFAMRPTSGLSRRASRAAYPPNVMRLNSYDR